MARNIKTESDGQPEIVSRKLDQALESELNVEAEAARAIWNENRECRMKVAKLIHIKIDPRAVETAKIEKESLNKQAKILSSISGSKVMSGGSGVPKKYASDIYIDHSIAEFSACSEQLFRPPYRRSFAFGLPGVLEGIDGEMTALRKTGRFTAELNIRNGSASLQVTSGFWIDFRLGVPVNPMLGALYPQGMSPPIRFGSMQIVADFAPLQTFWMIAARGLLASTKGYLLIAVAVDNAPWPVWHKTRLWSHSSVMTEEFNPLRDADYMSSRSYKSPWFSADSKTKYSAYVGVSVAAEGEVDSSGSYGCAWASIAGTLNSVKVLQCLLP